METQIVKVERTKIGGNDLVVVILDGLVLLVISEDSDITFSTLIYVLEEIQRSVVEEVKKCPLLDESMESSDILEFAKNIRCNVLKIINNVK